MSSSGTATRAGHAGQRERGRHRSGERRLFRRLPAGDDAGRPVRRLHQQRELTSPQPQPRARTSTCGTCRRGVTTLVSVDLSGGSRAASAPYDPSISADGRYVAFTSSDPDLTADPVNENPNVFVRDLVAATTTLVSINDSGTGTASGHAAESLEPVISPDGQYVAFVSNATDLVAGLGGTQRERPRPLSSRRAERPDAHGQRRRLRNVGQRHRPEQSTVPVQRRQQHADLRQRRPRTCTRMTRTSSPTSSPPRPPASARSAARCSTT